MAKNLAIALPDDLEQVLTAQAKQLNQSSEELVLQVLSQELTAQLQPPGTQSPDVDPLLLLIGSLSVDISDLAENHNYYIGQALLQELEPTESYVC